MNLDRFLSELYPLPTPDDTRRWDEEAAKAGLDEFVLMENAARAAMDALRSYTARIKGKTVLALMGSGNNGGDAAALARNLLNFGFSPHIISYKKPTDFSPVCLKHLNLALYSGANFHHLPENALARPEAFLELAVALCGGRPDIIIDGLLGTGFKGFLNEKMERLIRGVNYLSELLPSTFVFSLDIPSGLNALTGKASPVAVRADATANFAGVKTGEILTAARRWTGTIIACDIGLPKKITAENPCRYWLLDGHALNAFPSDHAEGSYKNVYGHVLVIGGHKGLNGAAHLAAQAALAAGAGLVTAVSPGSSCAQIKAGLPELMTLGLGDASTGKWPDSIDEELKNVLEKADSIVIGPGLGRDDDSAVFFETLLKSAPRKPLILDADALMLLARHPSWIDYLVSPAVLTPHPGEAGALLGCSAPDVQNDRFAALYELCKKFPAFTIILKGANALVGQLNQPVFVSPYDVPQLAIGGSGDVLSGCLGALAANRLLKDIPLIQATAFGVLLHALAGLICKKNFPHRGATASFLAQAIAKVWTAFKNVPGSIRNNVILPWPQSR